ncbi:MAG: hypothetical protein HY959_03755 [Ignavibacteriae bacterium]|nr:hypothetical protein [Ignavibacteriota bacterium]
MIDFNDKAILKQLKSIAETQAGKILIEYLKYCIAKHGYDTIDSKKPIKEVGYSFLVKKEVQDELNSIIKFLTSE